MARDLLVLRICLVLGRWARPPALVLPSGVGLPSYDDEEADEDGAVEVETEGEGK